MTPDARPPRLHAPRTIIPLLEHLADRRPRLLLVVFCLLCWLPGWFTLPATDRDEARFAQATRQMLETGDYVTIRNGTEARNRKPIGIHWLQIPGAAAARALGIAQDNPIWPYRLPSLLGALLAVLATHAIARQMRAGPRAALLAGAMLGGSLLLIVEAHLAKTDAALLGATTIAMAMLARAYGRTPLGAGHAALFWLALAAGVLIKGPITPMVVGLCAASLAIADRQARWLLGLRPAWGVPLLLAAVLPWFVAIGLATHGAFFRDAVGGDLGRKLAGGAESHGAPPGTHFALLMLTLFPSGWRALAALPGAWARRREPALRFLLAWAVPSWLVFEAVPTKLPHYVLPLFPALCLLAALAPPLAAQTPRLPRPRWLLPLGMPLLCAVALTAAPLVSPIWVSARLTQAVERLHPAGFAAAGYAEPSLMFTAGTATQLLDPPATAAWLRAEPGRIAAVEARVWPAFAAALGPATPQVLGVVEGLDTATGRRVRLSLVAVAPWHSRGGAQ